jgi:hypothetical protein
VLEECVIPVAVAPLEQWDRRAVEPLVTNRSDGPFEEVVSAPSTRSFSVPWPNLRAQVRGGGRKP